MHVDPVADAPLVLHVYATFAVGGPQVRFAAIANRFGPRWRHAVVAMDGNTACRERLDRSLDVTFPQVDIRKGDMAGNVLRFRRVLLAKSVQLVAELRVAQMRAKALRGYLHDTLDSRENGQSP